MKILAFADIHSSRRFLDPLMLASKWAKTENPDVVVIAGDIWEDGITMLFQMLDQSFEVPVVFCLGNHEFVNHTVEEIHEQARIMQKEHMGKLFCLDVLGHVKVNDVNFAGNVLWYDGTLSNLTEYQKEYYLTNIHSGWIDHYIKNFNCREENRKCVDQILPLQYETGQKVLVTHMVPHRALNWFETGQPDSMFNLYSGMSDLLSKINPNVAICGHTHKRVITTINNCQCYNIGNDYCRRDNIFIQKDIIEL